MIVGSMDTFVDFGDRVAVIGFTQGCNFNCWFCSNSKLKVQSYEDTTESFLLRIQKGIDFYDGIVISGGEPCMWGHKLIDFLRLLKSNFSLPIKLDTNGSYFEILSQILEEELVHTVAIDIKGDVYNFERMSETIGKDYTLDFCHDIIRSAQRLKEKDIFAIFRTTLIPTLNEVEFIQIVKFLVPGWDENTCEYHLQRYDEILSEKPVKNHKHNLNNYTDILRAYKINFKLKNF